MIRSVQGFAAVVTAALFSTAAAHADFTGFSLENKTGEYDGISNGFIVFELYANFDNALDTVINVFGGEIIANHNFYQPDELSLPSKKSFYDTNGPWDSFVTIGFPYGGSTGNPDGPDAGTNGDNNATTLDPGFFQDGFLFGSSIDDPAGDPTKGAGWFNSNPTAGNIQGQAGTYAGLKVLLARFTFEIVPGDAGQYTVGGKLSITYKPQNIGSAQVLNQQFGIVPGPAALSVLAMAGLARDRRRRT
jgi:hypothetical protein